MVGDNMIEYHITNAGYDWTITQNYLTREVLTTKVNNPYSTNIESNSASTVETLIQNRLSSDGMSLQRYVYSLQKGGILAIGKSEGTIRFYKFDANPLQHEQTFYMNNLPEYLNFYSITALSGGNFRITTSGNDIVFNYFTGNYTF